jgi:phosphate transport system ATP-binding protein
MGSAVAGEERTYHHAAVVQSSAGRPGGPEAEAERICQATVVLAPDRVVAITDHGEWCWLLDDLEAVHHSAEGPWSILVVPEVPDHGVEVQPADVEDFRRRLARLTGRHTSPPPPARPVAPPVAPPAPPVDPVAGRPVVRDPVVIDPVVIDLDAGPALPDATPPVAAEPARLRARPVAPAQPEGPQRLTGIEARSISAWFGTHHVLDRVSLEMPAGMVTALIGPSGCGKSTFVRILNRMHEMVPSASLAGEVLLDGVDIYGADRKLTDARRQIGMVFQKPNPFPAMSIYDNVVAGFRLTGTRISDRERDDVAESCLRKAGLWNEVRDRLRQPGGSLSGGQQQRLCIARALAIRPKVLLMDEPCSALDPTSTRRIEETIAELRAEVTIVIVTHNMQQAARVSQRCAFFLAEHGTPGVIVEHGDTETMFSAPQDPRTSDYVHGRFG